MILLCDINIKELFQKGTSYPWERPDSCLRCKYFKVWKHGFVGRYIGGFAKQVLVRRYRCPKCGCVYTIKPKGQWRRFWVTTSREIIRSIRNKLTTGKWLTGMTRQRQQYWFNGFKKQCVRAGYAVGTYTVKLLNALILGGTMPATHSLKHFSINSQLVS